MNERTQRQIDRLLDQAEEAIAALRWQEVRDRARAVLALAPENPDAQNYLTAAERALAGSNGRAGNSREPWEQVPSPRGRGTG